MDKIVTDYGDPVAENRSVLSTDVIADLSHLGLLEVRGVDAGDFLNRQFTTNIKEVTLHRGQLSAWCTPKGHVLTSFWIFKRAESYYLLLPQELVEMTMGRLRGYVLRDAVTIADASPELARIGLAGPRAVTLLKQSVGEIPQLPGEATQHGAVTLLRIPGPMPRFLALGEEPRLKALWQALATQIKPVGAGPWALLDILSGIPTITPATADAFLPQMLNFHALGALSFDKGCFPGQEVIARVRYRGAFKRRTYLGHVDMRAVPDPGDGLFAKKTSEPIGQVLNAQPHPDGGISMLAVIEIEAAMSGEARLHGQEGPTVHIQPLPYSFNAS
ncbi:MAG: folate-binding protein [Gammaproteobacteria bacterium]|nr:folate-binding protein [Gammaproteobacteria bacterium]MCI0590016.1 folate-binding protein [Gammaproteobacteria bacterium]